MKITLDQRVLSSLKEYLNYRMIKTLEAYSTKTLSLYQYTPTRFSNKVAYGSPVQNWVYDNSIVSVPTSFGGFVRGGSEGLIVDFKNGRLLMDGDETGKSISVTVPVNDFGIRITSALDSKLVAEVLPFMNPDQQPYSTHAKADASVAPIIFLKLTKTMNKPFSLSGLDWTSWRIRAIVFAHDYSDAIAVGSLLRDFKEEIFPILEADDTPLNKYNDLKIVGWQYSSFLTNPTDYAIIQESEFDIIENDTFTKVNPSLVVGVGEMEVIFARRPRS